MVPVKMSSFISNVLIAFVIFYTVLLIFFYISQTKLLLHPDKVMLTLPKQIYEEYKFKSGNSELHGVLSYQYNNRPIVLFSHGNAGNLSHRVGVMNTFDHLKLNFFMYDYRGFGLSEGQIEKEQDLYEDGLAAWHFLVTQKMIEPSNIIIWGRSLGAAIASKVAVKNPQAKALILDCPFSDIQKVGAYHYPYLPISLLTRYTMDNVASVQKIKMPIVISHSPNDEIIPFSLGKKVYTAANQPKLFIELTGGHNDGFEKSFLHYTSKLEEFLKLNKVLN
tara:strand:+ start:3315 stop:4148 length:834 start_codon:yes stop_codon:yes gene_type:complete